MSTYDLLSPETKRRNVEATKRFNLTPKGVLSRTYHQQRSSSKLRQHPMPNYTCEELYQRFLENATFLELCEAWKQGGYQKSLKPSLDRIDATKPYTLDNLQLMTWQENYRKSKQENRYTGVIMCDMEGREIRRFRSVVDAARALLASAGNIGSCCIGKRRQIKGYRWKYAGTFKHKNALRYPPEYRHLISKGASRTL